MPVATLPIGESGELIPEGAIEWAAMNEVRSLIDQRRDLVRAETRRIKLAQESVSIAEAETFIAAFFAALMRHVTNVAERDAVWADASAAIGLGSGRQPTSPF